MENEASKPWEGPAERTLSCPYHLACRSGPDKGLVIPLSDGGVIGRQTMPWLADPALPRLGWVVQESRAGSLTLLRIGSWEPSVLKYGRTFGLGAGTWELRPRPADPSWPLPRAAGQYRTWLRLLPALLLIGLTLRFIPGAAAVKIGIVSALILTIPVAFLGIWLRKRNRFDGAALSLAVAGAGAPQSGPPRPVRVYAHRWGGEKVTVRPGNVVGVVGHGARESARWIAAQLLLGGPGMIAQETLLLVDPSEVPAPRDMPPGSIVITWASSVRQLPGSVGQVLTASAPVGKNWLLPGPFSDPQEDDLLLLPTSVGLADLGVATDRDSIGHRWNTFSYDWAVPVAVGTGATTVSLDLPKQGPHALLAGATGSGKTVALRTWLWSLLAHVPPDALRLVLIDYKGGAGLRPLAQTPHAEVFATDLESGKAAWVLRKLVSVLQTRKAELLAADYADISAWESAWVTRKEHVKPPPRILVVVDEFQVLFEEHFELLGALTRLAAQGRSLGLHLIFATQRSGQAVTPDLRGTVDLRIGLRFTETADSQSTLGSAAAAQLPPIPGRAIVDDIPVQFARADPLPLPVRNMANENHWPRPLPESLTTATMDRGSIGLRESPSTEKGLAEVKFTRGALLLSGSESGELHDHASWVAQRVSDYTRWPIFEVQTGADNLGDIAILLTRIAQTVGSVLLVPDLPGLAHDFEFQGLGGEFAQAWRRVVGKGDRGELTVIAVDTEGTQFSRPFRRFLTRVHAPSHWQHPAVMRTVPQLPRLGNNLTDTSQLTREEAVTSTAGRFTATGFSKAGPFLIQLPTDIPKLPIQTNPNDDCGPHVLNGEQFIWREGLKLERVKPPSGPLTVFGATHDVMDWLEAEGVDTVRATNNNQISVLGTTTPWLYLSPPAELLRTLASRFPESSLWLRACYPYTQTEGVIVTSTAVSPVKLTVSPWGSAEA